MNECENCGKTSDDEDDFEGRYTSFGDMILYCKDCACCGECRELLRG